MMALFGKIVLLPFTIFNNSLSKYADLEMTLRRPYKHEAYVSAIGVSSIFNKTKLRDSKRQTFYFSTDTAAGHVIGFQLRLPTPNKIFIQFFKVKGYTFLYRVVVRGPMTVLMHRDSEAASINRYLFIRPDTVLPSQQRFEVVIVAQRLTKYFFIRLIGTSTSTMEYKLYRQNLKFTIDNDANIGDLTGISIRLPVGQGEFPYFAHITIKHNGKANTIVFKCPIRGPATFIKFLDKYEYKCQWTTWTEITLKRKGVARERKCFKYGMTVEKCDTCAGKYVELVKKDPTALDQSKTEGQNKALHGVIAVLVISMLLNAAMIGLAVYYRYFRRQKITQNKGTDEVTQTTDDVTGDVKSKDTDEVTETTVDVTSDVRNIGTNEVTEMTVDVTSDVRNKGTDEVTETIVDETNNVKKKSKKKIRRGRKKSTPDIINDKYDNV